LFILDHNFWSRNAKKSIQGWKNSDSSLVSNKNFSEILCLSGWAQGQVTRVKMTQNLFHLWHHSQEICKPQTKIFFKCEQEVWPIHLSPWTAHWCNRQRSYGIVNTIDNCWF